MMTTKILILISAGALTFAQPQPGTKVPAPAQKSFDTPEAAAQDLIDAAAAHNIVELDALVGAAGKKILSSGNADQDKAEQEEFAKIARNKHEIQQDAMDRNRMILSVGAEDWPFPIPIVKKNGKWMFDSAMGEQAMHARRIGANELDAIEICAGFVAAERAFAMRTPDHAFAATLAALEPDVPKEFAAATGGTAKPYHGYYFAVLKSQGPSATGGRHDFMVKNSMMGGVGLVAWPARYGVSGTHTFIVNQDGIVYEKDLGAHPAAPVASYNPDTTWRAVN